MASIIRKGRIPRALNGIGEELDLAYTLDGFFGDWNHMFRTRNPGMPRSWSSEDMIYNGIDCKALPTTDLTDPAGGPMTLMTADGVEIAVSRRAKAAPFAERNADYHQIRFYQKGDVLLETELGPLEVGPGDFVVIPRSITFREVPKGEDNLILIFETRDQVHTAEKHWDAAGFAAFFIDYSLMELPEPIEFSDAERDVPTDVRVKYRGKYEWLSYDFNPLKDVIGYAGDPLVFRLNVWDIPGIGTSHGFTPPATNAVLMSRNKSFAFAVMSPKPYPSRPGPDASYGAPAHLNDYEEVWWNHAAPGAEETDGHIWRVPPTLPHPGIKRDPFYPEGPVELVRELKINFDTREPLSFTPEAREHLMEDPKRAMAESMSGTHIHVEPDAALDHINF